MDNKPTTAAGYGGDFVALVRGACLYVATRLGDLIDELVVVGGLVPSLIIDQEGRPDAERHVGTMDLDLGLAVTLLDDGRYEELTKRLRRAGLGPDRNAAGKVTRQRWRFEGDIPLTVDFLIAPSRPDDRPGRLRDIEADFAAFIAPGLPLAFRDRRRVTLAGTTLHGEQATRDIWVCGPGAFVVLKALAFSNRGENKDAYDLYYVARNFGAGPREVAAALAPLLDAGEGQEAIAILQRDFTAIDAVGPRRVATFITGGPDDDIQADVVGVVSELLSAILPPAPASDGAT